MFGDCSFAHHHIVVFLLCRSTFTINILYMPRFSIGVAATLLARSLARCLCLLFVSCSVLPLQERFFFSFSFVVAQHPSFYIGRTEKNPKNQNSFSRSILFSGGPNIFFRYVYTSTSIHIYLCMWRVYLEGDRTQINKIFGKSNSSHDIQHTAINE